MAFSRGSNLPCSSLLILYYLFLHLLFLFYFLFRFFDLELVKEVGSRLLAGLEDANFAISVFLFDSAAPPSSADKSGNGLVPKSVIFLGWGKVDCLSSLLATSGQSDHGLRRKILGSLGNVPSGLVASSEALRSSYRGSAEFTYQTISVFVILFSGSRRSREARGLGLFTERASSRRVVIGIERLVNPIELLSINVPLETEDTAASGSRAGLHAGETSQLCRPL